MKRADLDRLDGILIAARHLVQHVDGSDETTALIVLLDFATEVVRDAYPDADDAGQVQP